MYWIQTYTECPRGNIICVRQANTDRCVAHRNINKILLAELTGLFVLKFRTEVVFSGNACFALHLGLVLHS